MRSFISRLDRLLPAAYWFCFAERLAVQLPSCILIYELLAADEGSGAYINRNFKVNLSPHLRSSQFQHSRQGLSWRVLISFSDIQYKPKWKIAKQLDCNLLVVTSLNIMLCQVITRFDSCQATELTTRIPTRSTYQQQSYTLKRWHVILL